MGKYHESVFRDHAIDYTSSIKWPAVGRRPFPMTEPHVARSVGDLIKEICPITKFSSPKNLSHFDMYPHEKLSLYNDSQREADLLKKRISIETFVRKNRIRPKGNG